MAKIAFLGLGVMGSGMASRLMSSGHQLSVYNRTVEKTHFLVKDGARLALTPREAAENADAIFSMVGDDEASQYVWLGDDGALAANLGRNVFAIECSTISYDWVMRLSGICSESGLTYVDCPVTGVPETAVSGELTLFVGAEKSVLQSVRPLLTPLCSEVIHFGSVGSGTCYKLMVNLMGSVQIAAAAEGLLISEKAGLDLETVTYALSKGAAASPQVVRNSHRMVAENHEDNVAFSGQWRLKDTLYGLKLAEEFGQKSRFGSVAGQIYKELVDKGFGDLNETKVIDVLRCLNSDVG
tara:strand:+ start:1593 stop:2483 length:891 start_codon:yes stop_codon:yes gene_type:complete